jgi:hypothetical protein
VLGSAQVVMEYEGARVVYSGDYKRAADPTCAPFRPVPCDLFITEATFGLPVFRHPPAAGEVARLLRSREIFPERCHVVGAYSLGKAQRLIALLRAAGYDRPVYVHGAVMPMCALYAEHGVDLGELRPATAGARGQARDELRGEIVVAPPSASPTAGPGACPTRWSAWPRLDAGPPAGPGAGRRAAAGAVRPRRLGRAAGDDPRGGAPGGVGDPRARGGAGPRGDGDGGQGAGAGDGGVRGGGGRELNRLGFVSRISCCAALSLMGIKISEVRRASGASRIVHFDQDMWKCLKILTTLYVLYDVRTVWAATTEKDNQQVSTALT